MKHSFPKVTSMVLALVAPDAASAYAISIYIFLILWMGATLQRFGEAATTQNVKLLCAIKRSVAEAKGTETMVKGSPGPLAVQRQRGWHRCQLFPCRPGERLTSDSGEEVALANLVVPPQRRVQAGPIASRGPQVKSLQAHAAAFALQLAVAATWRRPSAGVTAEAEPQWLGPSGPALCGVPSTSGSFQAAEEEQVDTPHSGADLARWTAAAERYFTNCPTKHL